MAKTIIFSAPVRLYGENFASSGPFLQRKWFPAQMPIQVNTLIQCATNKSYDFTLDGLKFQEVSPHLIEVIG
jgi:hypothetical protein